MHKDRKKRGLKYFSNQKEMPGFKEKHAKSCLEVGNDDIKRQLASKHLNDAQ
jgi:hypothetical protein